jgi:mannose-6-phosphate isomerase-like protein (cupin superfamily)
VSESSNCKQSAKRPFVKVLPVDGRSYFEVLNKEESVCIRSGMVTLTPGKDVGWHSTEKYEELLIILEGQGRLMAKGHPDLEIAKGQIAYNPPNTEHNVLNTGSEPLRYIYIVTLTE